MASKIKVDQIEGQSGTTVTLPSGQTLDLSSGSVTLPNNAVDLSSAKVTGTLGSSNLPTIPVTKGGTGLTSLGTANQVVAVNSGATALEFQNASSGLLLATYHSVDTTHRTTTNTTSYTKASNSLDITLTPASTSSKIHLLWVGQMNNNTASRRTHFSFFRDSTNLAEPTSTQEISGAYSVEMPAAVQFIDTPSTTSSITYSVQIKANAGDEAGIRYSRFHIWEYAS